MTNLTKLTAMAFAVTASALSLGTGPASALTCDGSWQSLNHHGNRQVQCYYLPTISNGHVTGLQYEQNYRLAPVTPGAVIGGVVPKRPPFHGGNK